MMTSSIDFFPKKLSLIDDLLLKDHHHLSNSDFCYFLGEYTARAGYAHSPTNNLIINFKKPMTRQGNPEWAYKLRAIRTAAKALKQALNEIDFQEFSFAPIPPSKPSTHSEFDDRVNSALKMAVGEQNVVDFLTTKEERNSYHDNSERCPVTLAENVNIDLDKLKQTRPNIILFDDVVTTGCHFRSLKDEIGKICSDKQVYGIFLARRAPESVDPREVFSNMNP